MTRSKELRRIEAAIADRNEAELKWALAQCELRRGFTKGHSHSWYQIEKRIITTLEEIRSESK